LQQVSIQAKALTRTYRRGSEDVHALLDVTLAIPPSAFAVVLGSSGSGKSTLLNLIGGIDQPTSGQLSVGAQRDGRLGCGSLPSRWELCDRR